MIIFYFILLNFLGYRWVSIFKCENISQNKTCSMKLFKIGFRIKKFDSDNNAKSILLPNMQYFIFFFFRRLMFQEKNFTFFWEGILSFHSYFTVYYFKCALQHVLAYLNHITKNSRKSFFWKLCESCTKNLRKSPKMSFKLMYCWWHRTNHWARPPHTAT